MRVRNTVLFAIVPLVVTSAFAQNVEVNAEYSYLRFNPTLASSGGLSEPKCR
jgi:hypothetical protein